jgi:hypothetical protein
VAITPYQRRSFSETAVATTLSGSITDTDLTCTLAASTGWPSGASGDFYIRVESEDIRVDTRTSTTLNFHADGRGANGTTAAAHASGVAVTLVFTSFDADEANYAVEQTIGKIAAIGDLLTGSAANALQAITLGTTGLPLVAGASIPAYGQLGTSGIADDAITAAKIGADAVGSAEIAADSITTSELADDAVATANIAALAVTTAKINALAVTAAELAANAVTTAKILDANVTEAKLATDAVTATKIAADAVGTSEIAADAVTTSELADDAVATANILAGNVTSAKLEDAMPRGTLGYTGKTSVQNTIATSATDLTSLATTVTVRAGSRIKISALAPFQQITSAGTPQLLIRESSTTLAQAQMYFASSGVTGSLYVVCVLTPSTGSHTYKLSALTDTNTVNMIASATVPAFILVEDIGT